MPNTNEYYDESDFSLEEIREAKLHDIESYFEEYFKPKETACANSTLQVTKTKLSY